MATDRKAKLDRLAPEVLAMIFTEHDLQPRDLAQITRACKALTGEAIRASYLHNIKHQRASVLIMAAQQGRIDWMRMALAIGADVNTTGPGRRETPQEMKNHRHSWVYPDDRRYGTPLHYAALRGNDDMASLLLRSGADLNAPSFQICRCKSPAPNEPFSRWLPLHHAVCRGHISTANLLLDHGAPLRMAYEESPDERSQSLIHAAASHGQLALVQRAVAMGTSVSKAIWNDNTPLHCAVMSWDSKPVIDYLLSAGAELDAVDVKGKDPLLLACTAGNFSIALVLLKAGVSTQWTELKKRELLYEAAIGGSKPIPLENRPRPLDDWDKEHIEILRFSGACWSCGVRRPRSTSVTRQMISQDIRPARLKNT